jgi:hypothetical protein
MKVRIRMLLAACVGATLISACASYARLSPDFGVAVRQDEAAQIANPEARYVGVPAPGSNGQRSELAQTRYVRGQVTEPVAIGAASAASVTGVGASPQAGTAPPPAAGQ